MEGDLDAGVSFMLTDEGWDTGPVIADLRTRVMEGETAGELESRLAALAAPALAGILDGYLDGSLPPKAQQGTPSQAPKIAASEASVDWSLPAGRLMRKIHALNPEPCARTAFRGRPLLLLRAAASGDPAPEGRVIRLSRSRIAVGCGEGSLELVEVQPDSRRAMTSAAFCAGYGPADGERLG